MAKNKITIDIEVNGKMQKATVSTKKLRDALDGVDKAQDKVSKGNDKYQRGLKGLGQQSANASKNFSKFSEGMTGFVGVYASLAAQLFAVSAAFNFLKTAGNLESLKAGQLAYASSTGVALRTLTNDIINATNAQVTFTDAAQAAAIGTAAGLSADQLTRLGKAAADAGQILGRDVTDSFNRLVRGVTKAEPELLDELGIILRLKDASDEYARQLGTTAEKLTQAQKSQAVANDVLGQAERKYSAILDVVGRTPNEFAQLGKAFDDITNKIKEVVALVAGPFATALKETPELAGAAFALLLSGPMRAMGFSFRDIAKDSRAAAESQEKDLKKLRKQREKMINTVDMHKAKLRDLAKAETGAGVKSSVLDKVAAGTPLSKQQQASLERSLKFAEGKIDEHGKITAGMFKGRDAKIIASFRTTMKNMETASDKTVSKYKLNMKQMEIATTAFGVKAKAVFAGIASGAGRLLGAFGWIGIAVVGYETVTAALEKYRTKSNDTAADFDTQQAIYQGTLERIASLNKEYEKLAQVTAIRISLADDLREVDLAAKAVSESIVTTFSPGTIRDMNVSLIKYGIQAKEVAENNKKLEESFSPAAEGAAHLTTSMVAFAAAGAYIGSLVAPGPGTLLGYLGGGIVGALAGMATALITMEEGADRAGNIARKINAKGMRLEIDKELQGVPEAFDRTISELEAFSSQVAQTEGISNFVVFEDFEKTLKLYKQAVDQGNESGFAARDIDNIRILGTVLGNEVVRVSSLNAHLKAIPDQLKAAGEALSAVEQSIVQRTAGDQLRLTAQAALESARAIANARKGGPTENDTTLISSLEAQVALGEKIAQQENDRKITAIELEGASIRNYRNMSKAEGELLKKRDEFIKTGETLNDLDVRRKNIQDTYIKEGEEITPEVQRQLDLIEAQEETERKRLALLGEEFQLLQDMQPFKESVEREQGIQKVLQLEKQILDFNQKTAKAQQDTARARAEMLMAESQTTFNTTTAQNPFINQERAAAEFRYEQAVIRLAIESKFIKEETQAKKDQINMEYKILESKRTMMVAQARLTQDELKARNLLDKATLDTFNEQIDTLNNLDYTAQRDALLDNADAQGERAKQKFENGVREAAANLEAEQPFDKVFNSAIDSLESGLQDAFMLVFDSLTTEMDDFNDQMKEVGRGMIRSIQEELTKQYLVQPLMDGINSFIGKDDPNDPAAKMKTALDVGGTDLAEKIRLALSGQPVPGESTTTDGTVPKGNYLLGPGKDTTPKASTKTGDGTTKTTSEAPAEGVGNLTKSIDNLTIETGVSVAAMGTVIAGLTGNSKAAQKLAAVTAALKAYQVVSDGIKKISDFKRDLTIQANTAAVASNTAAQASGGEGGGFLSAIAGFFGFGAKNGKMGMGYATGGIARGSQGGFPAVLHGTEAVVPLPDGRSIPVEMSGGAGQQNNVTVNVAVDNQGGATSSTGGISGDQAAKLGNAISEAVKKELLNQKRPGGMLSPYGVA